MKKQFLYTISVALIFLLPIHNANANFISAQRVISDFHGEDHISRMFAEGVASGILWSHIIQRQSIGLTTFCVPETLTIDGTLIFNQVKSHINDFPDDSSKPFSLIAMEAMKNTFPCNLK